MRLIFVLFKWSKKFFLKGLKSELRLKRINKCCGNSWEEVIEFILNSRRKEGYMIKCGLHFAEIPGKEELHYAWQERSISDRRCLCMKLVLEGFTSPCPVSVLNRSWINSASTRVGHLPESVHRYVKPRGPLAILVLQSLLRNFIIFVVTE